MPIEDISKQTDGFPSHLAWAVSMVENIDRSLKSHLVAVVVKGGKRLSWSANTPKLTAYARMMTKNPDCASSHAEIGAITQARKKSDLRGCKMYVARVTRNNWRGRERAEVRLARPCESCERVIAAHGIKRVFYTISPGSFGVMNVTCSEFPRRSKAGMKLPHS